jgi:hypothetical protein
MVSFCNDMRCFLRGEKKKEGTKTPLKPNEAIEIISDEMCQTETNVRDTSPPVFCLIHDVITVTSPFPHCI